MFAKRRGRRVLVVEDDLALRQLMALALTECGYTVEAVGDGSSALAALEARADDFYAILLDLMLPDFPGRVVLVRAKQLRPDLPVIVVSGNSLDAGPEADWSIQKPFGPNDIVAALDAAGDWHSAPH